MDEADAVSARGLRRGLTLSVAALCVQVPAGRLGDAV